MHTSPSLINSLVTPVELPHFATPEWTRPPLIATCAALSTRARAPSDPPAPLFVRARVSAHARTTRRGHGRRTRATRRHDAQNSPNTHGLIIKSLFRLFRVRELAGKISSASELHRCTCLQSRNSMALRHHITNIGQIVTPHYKLERYNMDIMTTHAFI